MHETLHPDIRGYIESMNPVRGWCFHSGASDFFVRVQYADSMEMLNLFEREDVSIFYKRPVHAFGWSFEKKGSYQLQLFYNNTWLTFFRHEAMITPQITSGLPSFLVVDNFYTNPDAVRSFALQQNLVAHPNNHKGIRSDEVYRFPGLKERFETLLGTKIRAWERYGTNGCFQMNIAGEQAVYHNDQQQYAGVLFLTPNAPGAAGTKFYRSKCGVRKPDDSNHASVFQGGFYDSTRFEQLDVVGNVYNRLVLFDAKLIHAADTYFGKTKEDSRLIQLFFFDLED